jgi:signal peptidase I
MANDTNKTKECLDEIKKEEYVRQTGSLKERLGRVKTTRWARFGLVALIYVLWTIWVGNPWLLLGLLLLGDIYLTQYLPWGAWKGMKKGPMRTIMSWVDAIVYALVLVYFLFLFIGQNYQIPSSSLEKSLLTGDFLWVNKVTYGPRVPQTPLHFPLAQNTLPFLNCKSYIEHPQLDYHRLKGLRNVERMDIVVFNFPAGDTVALKMPNPDYYTLCHDYGRDVVRNNPQDFGEIIYRPVDRRDNYVKRCLGLPGETIQIKGGIVYVDGKAVPQPEHVQYNYYVETDGTPISDDLFDELGISMDDRKVSRLDEYGRPLLLPNSYRLPLTAEMKKTLESNSWVKSVLRVQPDEQEFLRTYPVGTNYGWTHADYGPVWIPKKGAKVDLTVENLPLYERCIRNYEGNDLKVEGGRILINGKPATSYTFKMDYYWMQGDNRDNSLDSRYWGFVPEDHIVGTPAIILISFDKDHPLYNGGIRWNRIFKHPNPDKH